MLETRKLTLITHDDLDGAGCDVVFNIITRNLNTVTIHSHNNTVDDDTKLLASMYNPETTDIIFADICPSKEVLQLLKKDGFDCIVLDHHPTNEYATEVFPKSVIKNGPNYSGTSLLFKYLMDKFHPSMFNNYDGTRGLLWMTFFVDRVTSWDTFEWKNTGDTDAKLINDLLYIMKMNVFCEYIIGRYNRIDEIRQEDKSISMFSLNGPQNMINLYIDPIFMRMLEEKQHVEEELIESIVKNPKVIEFNLPETDYIASLMLAPTGVNISELATKYLAAYPKVDILIYYMQQYNTLSLRTARDNIDCGAICKKYGGGGHPKAAGCPMPDGFDYIILNNVEDYLEGRL